MKDHIANEIKQNFPPSETLDGKMSIASFLASSILLQKAEEDENGVDENKISGMYIICVYKEKILKTFLITNF